MAEDRYLISKVIHPGLVSESEEINLNIDAEHVYVKIKEGDDAERYVPLSVIIQNYSDYTDNARLTTIGPDIPSNPRMEIWIDTSTSGNGYNVIKHVPDTELGEQSGSNHQVGDNG